MYYIYCYINKINQHKYVGQTNNLKRRIREHRSCAFNEKASSYNDLFHKKIRQYGEKAFDIEVLEKLYTDDINIVNDKEQYWIKEKESYCGTGKGYNMDSGGGRKTISKILSPEELIDVKKRIKKGESYYDIGYRYHISPAFISSINQGVYYFDENETYPLHKFYKDDDEYDELIDLLLNSTYSYTKIAEMLEIGQSTIKKINAGTLRHGLYPNYPIRKVKANEQRANKIKDLLMHTDYTYKDIKDITGASSETIRRINIGQSFKDETLSYPLRKPVTTISG